MPLRFWPLQRPGLCVSCAIVQNWISNYIRLQKAALDSIPAEGVAQLIERLQSALHEDRQIFVFGNGGSAANASHFVTDLGKGSATRSAGGSACLSLNDNVSWMTALGNDYAYEDVFVRQLENYAPAGGLCWSMSVSGNSPNVRQSGRVGEGQRRVHGRAGRRPARRGWRRSPTSRSSSTPTTTAASRTRTWHLSHAVLRVHGTTRPGPISRRC